MNISQKISKFKELKKTYEQILNQIDSATFLNLNHLTHKINLTAEDNKDLLKLINQNSLVNQNVNELRKSIELKIKNLELLSQKALAEQKTSKEDINIQIQNAINNELFNHSSSTYETVEKDIDQTVQKISQVEQYLEGEVLKQIVNLESEVESNRELIFKLDLELKNTLNLQKAKEEEIEILKTLNHSLSKENDKSLQLWASTNDKLVALETLVEQNELDQKTLSDERQMLVDELEKKLGFFLNSDSDNSSQLDIYTGSFNNQLKQLLEKDSNWSLAENFLVILYNQFTKIFNKFKQLERKLNISHRSFTTAKAKFNELLNVLKNIKQKPLDNLVEYKEEVRMGDDLFINEFDTYKNINSVDQFKQYIKEKIIQKIDQVITLHLNVKDLFLKIVSSFLNHIAKDLTYKFNLQLEDLNAWINTLLELKNDSYEMINELNSNDSVQFNRNLVHHPFFLNLAYYLEKLDLSLSSYSKISTNLLKVLYDYSFKAELSDFNVFNKVDEVFKQKIAINPFDENFLINEEVKKRTDQTLLNKIAQLEQEISDLKNKKPETKEVIISDQLEMHNHLSEKMSNFLTQLYNKNLKLKLAESKLSLVKNLISLSKNKQYLAVLKE